MVSLSSQQSVSRPSNSEQEKALVDLKWMMEEISKLKKRPRESLAFYKWKQITKKAISKLYGRRSAQAKKFSKLKYCPSHSGKEHITSQEMQEAYRNGLNKAKSQIREILRSWNEDDQIINSHSPEGINANNRKVFAIHGHDEAAKHEVARLIQKLGLVPVILAEQPSKGRTIIEKFDEHADVGYAIALLTADDIGSRQGEDGARPRARQNVIFELGYFIGRLGRERVCALTKGEPEIPSDYSGVVYISMDAGDWKTELTRELKAADFNIDANRMFE